MVGRLWSRWQFLDGFGNDLESLLDILFRNDERWGESDNGIVGGFGEQSLFLHQETEVPCRAAVGFRRVNDDGVEKAHSTDLSHDASFQERLESFSKLLTEDLCALSEVLVLDDLEGGNGDGAGEGVTTVGGSVGAGLDAEHNVFRGKDGRDGGDAAGNGLAQEDHVGLDV